jgi:hypothetical protein
MNCGAIPDNTLKIIAINGPYHILIEAKNIPL